jgi:MFS family permease
MAIAASLAPVAQLLRREPRARTLLVAHAQSSLGTGAAYVALLVLAYDRFRSPWAVTLVLLADLVPAMAFGPLFGAAADRWSRRRCVVVADVVRAIAFLGIALVGSFEAMVGFAALAGIGTALYGPAVLAGLPSLVSEKRLPAATSLYGAIDELGWTAGPLLAAGALVFASPETLTLANGLTFAVSALLIARIPFGAKPADPKPGREKSPSLVQQAGDGLRALGELPAVRTIMLASSGLLVFAAGLNVGELFLATEELGAGQSGYAVLLAVFGVGVVLGSLAGSRGGTPAQLKNGFLAGMLLAGVAFLASGLAPTFGAAVAAFALGGVGNGLVIVHERLLLQAVVPDAFMGRMFAIKDTLQCWGFAPGFLGAGALAILVGPRTLFLIAGAGSLLIWLAASLALRAAWGEGRPGAAALQPAFERSASGMA